MEVARRPVPDLETVRSHIDDLEPRLRSEFDNGCLRFSFREEKNIFDPVSNISASSSFLCGYDGDEEDNEVQSICDTSLFNGKDQHRPTLEGFMPDVFSEETNKYSPEPFANEVGGGGAADNCNCRPATTELESNGVSVDRLTAAFSATCSCSSSLSGRSSSDARCKPDLRKRSVHARRFSMQLRSTAKDEDFISKEDTENTDRERRKRSANWPVCHHSERKGVLRSKVDCKEGKKKPWRY